MAKNGTMKTDDTLSQVLGDALAKPPSSTNFLALQGQTTLGQQHTLQVGLPADMNGQAGSTSYFHAFVHPGAAGLAQKLSRVRSEVPYLEKTGFNQHFKYQFVSEAHVKAKLQPLFVKYGVEFDFEVLGVVERELIGSKNGWLTTITARYTFTDTDSGYSFSRQSMGQGCDPADKGLPKAIASCIKYILTSVFLIPTGDDPEDDPNTDRNAEGPPATPPAPPAPVVPCEDCKGPILAVNTENGKHYSIEDVRASTFKVHGVNLCASCSAERNRLRTKTSGMPKPADTK